MRALGIVAITTSLFGLLWMWCVNGLPRTIEHWIGYMICSAGMVVMACAGAAAWAIGGGQ